MGGGTYCATNAATRSTKMGYDTKSTHEVFTQKNINQAMNPQGIQMRESRDSEEHPNSLAIVIGLDVTGSMGSVPHNLVKQGLTHIMANTIEQGERDPQVLFLGIGDHECDRAPLQVGQFESSDELLDKWLTSVYLEGGGGGNGGESYLLSWYFAAMYTSIDCFEKRGRKGLLFTIGDEPCLPEVPNYSLQTIMGDGQHQTYQAADLIRMASEKYNIYHINIGHNYSGRSASTISQWKQLLHDNCILVEHGNDVPKAIAEIIASHTSLDVAIQQSENKVDTPASTEIPNML